MGNKRIGWARIQSLINENSNQLGPRYAKVRSVITADTTLTAGDYGTTILLSANAAATNFTITLPTSPPVGAELKFVLTANSAANSTLVVDSGVSHTINGYAVVLQAAANATAFHSHRKLGWGDSAAKGGTLHLVASASKHWMIVDSRSDVTWVNTH